MNAKENVLRAIRRQNPKWVPQGLEATIWISSPVVERPSSEGCDAFGVHWSYKNDAEGGTYPTLGKQPISDIRRWQRQIQIPDLSAIDWRPVEREVSTVDREESLVMGFVEMGLFERAYLLLGMQEALIAYMTEPERMSALVGAIADYKIALIREFHARAQLDMVWYGDDWGTQKRLFIAPRVWRRIIKPHTQRIYACVKDLGLLMNQHSCGKIESVFEDMVEMGADLWNPCQPCNELARLKRDYGHRIAFCGGIDSQFVLSRPNVTPDEVRAEVRKRIDEMAGGGGYLAEPSHSVPYDPAILNAMRDEIATYGRTIYAGR